MISMVFPSASRPLSRDVEPVVLIFSEKNYLLIGTDEVLSSLNWPLGTNCKYMRKTVDGRVDLDVWIHSGDEHTTQKKITNEAVTMWLAIMLTAP